MLRRSAPVFALSLAIFIAVALLSAEGEEPRAAESTDVPQTRFKPVPTQIAPAPGEEPAPQGLPAVDASEPPLIDAGTEQDAGATLDPAPAPPPVAVLEGPQPTSPLAIDAGIRTPNDPRFTVRWGQAGLCGEEPLARMEQRRAALLATFIGVRRAGTLVYADPDAPQAFVDQVGASLAEARVIITRLLGPSADVALPVIYVYATADQMRDVACVNTATAGYYDGAIHLPATDPDAHRTVIHEHVHHVLNALGLRKPMWLHEGLAMYAADERWWEDPRLGLTAWLHGQHLPFPALVEAFPHTADELFAGAAYYQSYQMVSFLRARSGRADFFWLVEGLTSGRLTAPTAFGESVGLQDEQLESAWRSFIQSR